MDEKECDCLSNTCPEGSGNSKAFKHWKKEIRKDRKSYFIKQTTYYEWTPVVFSILVLEENVNDSGGQGVEEGEDSHGDEELCRR